MKLSLLFESAAVMGQTMMPQPHLGLGQTPQEQQQDQLQELFQDFSVHMQYLEELQGPHVGFMSAWVLYGLQEAHQRRDLPLYQVYEADIKKQKRDLSNSLYDNGDLQIPTVERGLFSNLLLMGGSAVESFAVLSVLLETTKKGKSQEASSQSQRLLKTEVVKVHSASWRVNTVLSLLECTTISVISCLPVFTAISDQSPSVHNDLSDQLSPSVHSDLIASVHNDLSDQLSPSVHSDQSPSVHSDQSFPSVHSAILGLSKTDNHSDLCFLTTGKCSDINNECKVPVPIFWACGHNLGGPPRPHYQREELA